MKTGKETITKQDAFNRFAPCFNFEKNADQIFEFFINKGYGVLETSDTIILDWDKVPE